LPEQYVVLGVYQAVAVEVGRFVIRMVLGNALASAEARRSLAGNIILDIRGKFV